MMDAKAGKAGLPSYAYDYAEKAFNDEAYKVIKDMYEEFENEGRLEELREVSLYSSGPIGELIKNAREAGIAIMPLGAGGPGANLIAVSSKGQKHLTEFMESQGLGKLDEEEARQIIRGIDKDGNKEKDVRPSASLGCWSLVPIA
jgi:hypothetical protein